MANNKNVLQRLTDVVIGVGNGTSSVPQRKITTYNVAPSSTILGTYKSKEERDRKLTQLKQEKLLAYQWAKSGYDTTVEQMVGANQVKVMYRDADLMDAWPEIGAALDTVSEESTTINKKGKMLNIYSDSPRVASILEDLFVNRLDIAITLPMIFRATAKYGNDFMFLNVSSENGIMGWRELPVHEMKRIENGILNQYTGGISYGIATNNMKPDEVKFVWEGHNESMPYRNWQIAHFRLIKDSLLLPYGVSFLNKARRHWRMLSMMEDGMLLYRLERSIERRIFKVNVGLIDDKDVPAFLQEFMNNVKRAPIIDPQTGQMDLRKNFLDVSADYVIPIRNSNDQTSIETLQGAQNQTSMDDIEYIQNKVLTALRVPKTFLNFQDSQGKQQNMSLIDIRFSRVITSIQQSILLELNKIAMIHLYILGFEDDLTNFSLSLNNPSNQLEVMELDNLTKRITAASSALAEQGGGLPLMSWHKVQKEIMGMTDTEISDMLNEIRVESALAIELTRTYEIIKKTRMFDKADRIYGEPGAAYNPNFNPNGEEGGLGGGGGIGGGDLGGLGGDMSLGDLGEPGADESGDIGGDEGGEPLGDMGGAPLNENKSKTELLLETYSMLINKNEAKQNKKPTIIDKSLMVNETIHSALTNIETDILKNNKDILKEIIK